MRYIHKEKYRATDDWLLPLSGVAEYQQHHVGPCGTDGLASESFFRDPRSFPCNSRKSHLKE
ncbi:MAG: hypothetical protein PVH19_12560 [Planctomycetia bacterium]